MTPYSTIFDMFLLKIYDIDLFQSFSQEEIEKVMTKYLFLACANFEMCKQDLSKRDDASQMFFIELSGKEIDILSHMMVDNWLTPFINNRMNLQAYLGDREFKIFSQANHTKSLLDLKQQLASEISSKTMSYSWAGSTFNFD